MCSILSSVVLHGTIYNKKNCIVKEMVRFILFYWERLIDWLIDWLVLQRRAQTRCGRWRSCSSSSARSSTSSSSSRPSRTPWQRRMPWWVQTLGKRIHSPSPQVEFKILMFRIRIQVVFWMLKHYKIILLLKKLRYTGIYLSIDFFWTENHIIIK